MSHPIQNVQPVTSHPAHQLNEAEVSAKVAALCAQQETLLRFTEFSDVLAWEIGSLIRENFLDARKTGAYAADAGIVVHIELFDGHTLFSCAVGRPPAVGPDNWLWVRGKFNVVKRFNVSSLRKGRELAAKGQTPESKGLHFPEYACHGGAFPIWLASNDTCPIGAIVVSGLPQLSDHQLIIDTLAKAAHLFPSHS